MCMGKPYTAKYQKAVIRVMAGSKDYIRLYKVACRRGSGFYPPHFWMKDNYLSGVRSVPNPEDKEGGWHAFRDLKSAKRYAHSRQTILTCLAKPEWVKNCGNDCGFKTILLTTLCFPAFPRTRVTVREFRQALKKVKLAELAGK